MSVIRVFSRAHSLWQFFLLGVRPWFRDPQSLFWSMGFPLLMTFLLQGTSGKTSQGALPFVAVSESATGPLVETLQKSPLFHTLVVPFSTWDGKRTAPMEWDALVLAGPKVMVFNPEVLPALRAVNDSLRPGALEAETVGPFGVRFLTWFAPGVVAFSVFRRNLFTVGTRVCEDRATGFLKRLRLSPFRPFDYFFGIVSSQLVLSLLETSLLLAVFYLGMGWSPPQGLFWFLLGVVPIAWATSSISLLLAARLSSQSSINGLLSGVFFPCMMLSGVWFKTTDFSPLFQVLGGANPLGLSAQLLRSDTLGVATPLLLGLGLWTALGLVLSARFFRWDKGGG